jgi:hypothetical protein
VKNLEIFRKSPFLSGGSICDVHCLNAPLICIVKFITESVVPFLFQLCSNRASQDAAFHSCFNLVQPGAFWSLAEVRSIRVLRWFERATLHEQRRFFPRVLFHLRSKLVRTLGLLHERLNGSMLVRTSQFQ